MPIKLALVKYSYMSYSVLDSQSLSFVIIVFPICQNVKAGEIYDKARVLRMDKRAGLFLEIPSPTPSPGFVSVCHFIECSVVNIIIIDWPMRVSHYIFKYIFRYMMSQTKM